MYNKDLLKKIAFFTTIIILPSFIYFQEKLWISHYTVQALGANYTSVSLSLNSDNLPFLFGTTIVSVVTVCFSPSYFTKTPDLVRFYGLLITFSGSIILVFLSFNFYTLFLSWELMGLSSFYLIVFNFRRAWTYKSASKVFVYNKLSDWALLVAFLLCVRATGTDILYTSVTSLLDGGTELIFGFIPIKVLIVIFLLLAASIKSATFGFHNWLPDSMEAPTPASALIHSSTLVSAGIFVVCKFKFIILQYPLLVITLVTLNLVGFVLNAATAIAQTNIKRLLAYSTIANCNLMFISGLLCTSDILVGLFVSHALAKSILFLLLGELFNNSSHSQSIHNIRSKYGISLLPITNHFV